MCVACCARDGVRRACACGRAGDPSSPTFNATHPVHGSPVPSLGLGAIAAAAAAESVSASAAPPDAQAPAAQAPLRNVAALSPVAPGVETGTPRPGYVADSEAAKAPAASAASAAAVHTATPRPGLAAPPEPSSGPGPDTPRVLESAPPPADPPPANPPPPPPPAASEAASAPPAEVSASPPKPLATVAAAVSPACERADTPASPTVLASKAASEAASEAVAEAVVELEGVSLVEDGDNDWTTEAELAPPLTQLVDAEIAKARDELTTMLALEAVKWRLCKKLSPADAAAPKLANMLGGALTMRKEELGRAKPPVFATASPEEAVECESCWQQRMAALLIELRGDEHAATAEAAGEPWFQAILAAKKEVMDPNEDRLSSHLEGMWTDHVSAAERDLKGSRLRDVMKARARTIHNTLKGAMDDVERQFCDGMRPLVKARLAKLPPSTPRPLDDVQISALCTATVKAFRVGFDRPWEIATLEKHLAGSMEPDPAADAPSRVLRAASDISTDPVGYLLGLVLGSAELPIAVETRDWLASTVAAYLDPFIDGEVPSSEYHSRSSGFFMERYDGRSVARVFAHVVQSTIGSSIPSLLSVARTPQVAKGMARDARRRFTDAHSSPERPCAVRHALYHQDEHQLRLRPSQSRHWPTAHDRRGDQPLLRRARHAHTVPTPVRAASRAHVAPQLHLCWLICVISLAPTHATF